MRPGTETLADQVGRMLPHEHRALLEAMDAIALDELLLAAVQAVSTKAKTEHVVAAGLLAEMLGVDRADGAPPNGAPSNTIEEPDDGPIHF